ncbi:MAG: hypothetical protein QFC55_00265 [Chloroflexota bacterium]|nr:hypothetical protein [Chloroflexota bacterium]
MNARGALAISLLVAACGAATPATTRPSVTPAPTPAATASEAPTPTVGAPDTSAFDGIWASAPLTRDMMVAALTAHGLDPSNFDEMFPDFGLIGHYVLEAEIGAGRWRHLDFEDGVTVGGWGGTISHAGANSITVTADDNPCSVSFGLVRSGDQLTVSVGQDDCPNDLAYEVAAYEAAPLTLIQAADWQAPDWSAPQVPPPPSTPGPSTSRDRLAFKFAGTVPGAPLGYLEYLPPSYSKKGDPSPLLLFLHGSGESGVGDVRGLAVLAGAGLPILIQTNQWPDDRPFVMLAPQHDDSTPPLFCMTADEINDFISFALDQYNVDPNRIYLTGLSCGAIGLWSYLDKYGGDAIAAALPIAGNGVQAIEDHGCALGATPIWAFHGAKDPNVVPRDEIYPMTVLHDCTSPAAADARFTLYPQFSHDVWTRTYNLQSGYDIYSWLLSHTK